MKPVFIIFALLLSCGVVEAAHFELPDNCHWTNDDPRTASFTCETPPPGTILKLDGERIFNNPPCYQRMQEAMKAMDRYVQIGPWQRDNIFHPSADKSQWNSVMKECIR